MLDEPDQQAVIRGLRLGDRNAWSALYDGYSADIWRYVARIVGPEAFTVADIVQETFLLAARSASNFDPARGTLWAWLSGIAHHQCSVHWRQMTRIQRLKSLVETRATELRRWLETSEAADEVWLRLELADAVRGVLAELPADYAALLTGKYLDGRTLDDLALASGGTVEATKSKLARARREFRARMETLVREPNTRRPDCEVR